jgi:hypothetical protein
VVAAVSHLFEHHLNVPVALEHLSLESLVDDTKPYESALQAD